MDEITVILNKFGWGGFVLFLIAKYGNLWWKKYTGRYVSYKSLDNRLEKVEDLVPILQQHLKDSTERVADLAVLKKDNELNNKFMQEGNKDMKEDIKNIYRMLEDIKNRLIERLN